MRQMWQQSCDLTYSQHFLFLFYRNHLLCFPVSQSYKRSLNTGYRNKTRTT